MMTATECRNALYAAGYKRSEVSVKKWKGHANCIATIYDKIPEWAIREVLPGAFVQYRASDEIRYREMARARVVGHLPVGSEVTCQIAPVGKLPNGGTCDLRSPGHYRLIRHEADRFQLEVWSGLAAASTGERARAQVDAEGRWVPAWGHWVDGAWDPVMDSAMLVEHPLTGYEAAHALGMLHLRSGAMGVLQPPQSWIVPHVSYLTSRPPLR
jgi:hypothetical protein